MAWWADEPHMPVGCNPFYRLTGSNGLSSMLQMHIACNAHCH